MKTKLRLYIAWGVLSLGLLGCAADTDDPPFARRKKVFKLGKDNRPAPSSAGFPGGEPPLSRPAAAPGPAAGPGPGEPRDFARLPDVSVSCSASDFVVRVRPAFYGLGADAQELRLGRGCRSNGVLRPYGDLLFSYPLTACGAVRQSRRGHLVYKVVLSYEPSSKRFPGGARRVDVDIECRYQRNHHVHQLIVRPTWETAVVRKRLKGGPGDFQIQLMDDSWSRPAEAQVYQLGKTVNLQIFAHHLPTEGKLYINSCYAAPSSGSKESLKYTIIDNFGCMLDSKTDPGASRFVSRTHNTLRFSLKAFQFTSDPDTEVSIHCKVFVTSADPSPAHKSCTYRGNRWKALTGDDSICECCDSQCVTSKPRRAMMEGSASSGSLLVSDQSYTAEDGFLPVSMSREGEATISHYVDELHSHENVWERADVVMDDTDEEEQLEEKSGLILGVMAEPDVDELALRERVLVEEKEDSEGKESNQFEEDGSGYIIVEGFSEREEEEGFEGGDEEISVQHFNQKEGEAFRHWVQVQQMLPSEVSLHRALQPLASEGEEENRKRVGEEDEASEEDWVTDSLADLVDDTEMTWYFTWS